MKICDPVHYRDDAGGSCCAAWKIGPPTDADVTLDWFWAALPNGSASSVAATHGTTGPNTWHLPSECPDGL
jgi:hypothetical protein